MERMVHSVEHSFDRGVRWYRCLLLVNRSPGSVMSVFLSLMLQIYDDMVHFVCCVCMSMMRLGSFLGCFVYRCPADQPKRDKC